MLEQYITDVKRIARSMRAHTSVTRDELISAGLLGLVQARDRFDPSNGASFKTYAIYRVQGAMRDYLRSLDPMTRHGRRQAKEAGENGAQLCELRQQLPVSTNQESPEDRTIRRQLTARLRQAIADLSDERQRTLILWRLAGWHLRECAAELGMSVSGAAVTERRAVQSLRETFGFPGQSAIQKARLTSNQPST